MFRLHAVVIGIVATFAVMVVGVFFAPATIGGSATYAITDGTSMAPRFESGDLVIIRRTSHVGVGDIAAYRSGLTGQVVVHRIIAEENGKFTFKGDNNSWVDSYQPTKDELLGTLWVHVHGVGPMLATARNPWTAGVLGGLLTMTLASTPNERRSRVDGSADRRQLQHAPSGSRGLVGTPGQALLGALVVLTLVLCGVTALAFRSHESVVVPTQTPFTGTADFGYEGQAPVGPVYQDRGVQTGDPIYVHLVPSVTYTFDYDLNAPGATDVSGTVRYYIDIRDINGWARTFVLQDATPFTGTQVSLSAPVDLAALMAEATVVQTETGAPGRYWTAAVVAEIHVQGNLAGEPFESNFKPYYTLRVNPPDEVYLETAATRIFEDLDPSLAESGSDPFHQSQNFEVTTNEEEPASISFALGTIRVSTLRILATVSFIACLAVTLTLGAFITIALLKSKTNRLYARYGGSLVHVDSIHLPPNEQRIGMSSMDDLVRVANRLQSVILWIHHGGGETYAVQDGARTYVFHVKSDEAAVEQ